MLRFAVLVHETPSRLARQPRGGPTGIAAGTQHWDWLFERPHDQGSQRPPAGPDARTLRTWATDPLTIGGAAHPGVSARRDVPALALPDHRAVYLEFQGDIGGGRGHVTRLAAGRYETIDSSPSRFIAELEIASGGLSGLGPRLRVSLRPSRGGDGDAWETPPQWQMDVQSI